MILDARESREPWREPWEEVDPDLLTTLADEITSVSALLASETRRLLSLIARFDRLQGWKREGFASCASWLAYRTGLDKGAARERVRVARALAELPETDAAMSRGELSFSQVRALTRIADSESEAELLGYARSMTASELERLVRSWKRLDRHDEAAAEAIRHASRTLSIFPDDDGSFVIRGRLDPEVGALVMRAIEAASDALYRGSVPEVTPEQRRADALGLLAERALASPGLEGEESAGLGRSERYLVVLHADDHTLSESGDPDRSHLEDGTRVPAETSRRIACDAAVVDAGAGDGAAGGAAASAGHARTRVVPPRMRRALDLRDRGCRFPGCGSRYTDAHHIRHWADGGKTTLDNLVLLCRTHHRLLHEGGFRLQADRRRPGAATFFTPTGVRIPETPPPMRLDGRRIGGEEGGKGPARDLAWERDLPLAFYLKALDGMG
ncbi:MAG: DUF222 domain-containing protein [Gemmatimonadota bacterium]